MSDKVRILLGLGAFLVASVIVVGVSSVHRKAQDGIAPWAKYIDYTTDDTPVEIITGGPAGQTKFRIPKAYLPIGQHQKGGVQDFIAIEAAWPDMRPWVFTKYERGSPTGRGNKSERYEIYIKIGPGRDYMGKRHEEELKERRLQYNHELDIGLIYLGSPIIQKDDGIFYLQGDGLHNFYIKSESSEYKLDENVGFYITCINQ